MRARGLTTIPAMAAKFHLPFPRIKCLFLQGKEKFVSRLRVRRRSDGSFLFGIFEDFSLVVANHYLFAIMIQNIPGVNRNFASAPGRINDELWYGVACRVPAQAFDDFDSFRNGSAKVRRTVNQIALVDVVGPHT